jgi:hypothetical protein
MDDDPNGRLTLAEGRLMLSLFARYCQHDLDQFDFWRITLPSGGDVYVDVSDGLPFSTNPRDAYRKVWPTPTEA